MKYRSKLTIIAHDKGAIRFRDGIYETENEEEITLLDSHPAVNKETEKVYVPLNDLNVHTAVKSGKDRRKKGE